jgi:hypothetical protein
MPFALHLQDSLRDRHCQVEWEFAAGDSLETVLARHLLAVEASADTELLTSILLLDESGQRILHGAAPSLPPSYCEAIHGAEIGPKAGSCGTAAYTGRPIYVTDVAIDPLWDDYRHLALPHGLRACWSTPIRNPAGKVIATFAIYHPTPRSPTPGEVEAIRLITDHIAQVIMWDRSSSVGREHSGIDNAVTNPVHVPLANDNRSASSNDDDAGFQGSGATGRFRDFALKLDRYAELVTSRKFAAALKAAAAECRKLDQAAENRHKLPKDEH